MEYLVPKFIERKPMIVWKINFHQFVLLSLTGGVLGILYLVIKSKMIFYTIAFFTTLIGFSLVFIKIGGRPLPVVLMNFSAFIFKPRFYLWKRKSAPARLLKSAKMPIPKKDEEKGTVSLRITDKSYLQDMMKRIETGK